ncbi:MAG: sugar ABC transporter permease [Spirochaetia bacterium]|jgi:alpha-1,4-digalacturonate transport system permease protein|nr:sugar ABC transporter permease [Spirochaetia bacterium]MCE1207988.1 sugar ABC transporter permease [Spirochaetia bacterium]
MRKKSKNSFNQSTAPLLFLLPNMIIFSVFIIIPAFQGLRMATYEWGILSTPRYIGAANLLEMLKDAIFWKTFTNTLVYSLFSVPLLVVAALLLAYFLQDNSMKGVRFFRSLFYIPSLLSMITVGIAWRFLLGDDMGIVNYLIRSMGGQGVHWLTESGTAMMSIILITVWAGAGYFMVIMIAGLQAIPQELYEAARIDGASRGETFWKITLPMLRGTILVTLVLATISSFKAYELIIVTTGGGPGYATKFIVQQVYQAAFMEDRMGYAAMMSIVLMILIAAITAFQFALSGKKQDYE